MKRSLALLAVLLIAGWLYSKRAHADLPAWFLDTPVRDVIAPDRVRFFGGSTYWCWFRDTTEAEWAIWRFTPGESIADLNWLATLTQTELDLCAYKQPCGVCHQ